MNRIEDKIKTKVYVVFVVAAVLMTMGCFASLERSFIQISQEKWAEDSEYTPFVLQPSPAACLMLGPLADSASDLVQLLYAESDLSVEKVVSYELFQSGLPIATGEEILPMHSLKKDRVSVESKVLMIGGQAYSAEIRANSEFDNYKVAIIEIDNTHIAFAWQNVEDETAYQVLENSLTTLDPSIAVAQNGCS